MICGKTRKACFDLSFNLSFVKMTLKGFGNIHAIGNNCMNTLPCVSPKSIPVFLTSDGEASCLMFSRLVSLLKKR